MESLWNPIYLNPVLSIKEVKSDPLFFPHHFPKQLVLATHPFFEECVLVC